ncbi:MAG: hypothetical protein ACOY58_03550 [Candidatus Micrarchaeota archaeon]
MSTERLGVSEDDIRRLSQALESKHYHLWSDVLHARELARTTKSEWDRGTYVRWAVVSAFTVLELSCADAFEVPKMGDDFKRGLDKLVKDAGLPGLDWGSGLWQDVLELRGKRRKWVHRIENETDLFPDCSVADKAIEVVHEAVAKVYSMNKRPAPLWLSLEKDWGWGGRRGPHIEFHPCVGNTEALEAVVVGYVHKGIDRRHRALPAGSDPVPVIEDLIKTSPWPLSCVYVEIGGIRVLEIPLRFRGT